MLTRDQAWYLVSEGLNKLFGDGTCGQPHGMLRSMTDAVTSAARKVHEAAGAVNAAAKSAEAYFTAAKINLNKVG